MMSLCTAEMNYGDDQKHMVKCQVESGLYAFILVKCRCFPDCETLQVLWTNSLKLHSSEHTLTNKLLQAMRYDRGLITKTSIPIGSYLGEGYT